MKLYNINQLKNCIRTYHEVDVFRFYIGNGDYKSVWASPDKEYNPHDRISKILFDLSLSGRVLSSCSVEKSMTLGRRVFVIGSRASLKYETNIDADLVQFFNDEIDKRRERKLAEEELYSDIPRMP